MRTFRLLPTTSRKGPSTPAAPSGEAKDAPTPERLRVHSLARVLGTTSKRIIDALVELDGRTRSAHSSIGRDEADRVREALAEAAPAAEPVPAAEPTPEAEPAPAAEPTPEAELATLTAEAGKPEPDAAAPEAEPAIEVPEEEPESRLILETPASPSPEPADYLPLFVAPQPVRFQEARDRGDESDDDDDEDDDRRGRRVGFRRRPDRSSGRQAPQAGTSRPWPWSRRAERRRFRLRDGRRRRRSERRRPVGVG